MGPRSTFRSGGGWKIWILNFDGRWKKWRCEVSAAQTIARMPGAQLLRAGLARSPCVQQQSRNIRRAAQRSVSARSTKSRNPYARSTPCAGSTRREPARNRPVTGNVSR
ncbi:hypothetical protein C2S51_007595 [Perilla frutescens var. frutescens]|nr:hypothetical protein C2S51_007595 [Perilla frutescens var. frutescens]